MSFASVDFVIYFVVVIFSVLLLQQCRKTVYKDVFLLGASYFFYGYWDWRFCILLMFVTASAYITALLSHKKTAFILGVSVPLIVLAFFKYFNFFLDSI